MSLELAFAEMCELVGADVLEGIERTRTADLSSLRVRIHALQGYAGDCKCRIFKGISFPCLAACCTELRSQWYQSGIKPCHEFDR